MRILNLPIYTLRRFNEHLTIHLGIVKNEGIRQYFNYFYTYRKKWFLKLLGSPAEHPSPEPPAERIAEDHLSRLHEIVGAHGNCKGIIVFPPTVDWDTPLFQRPEHMALQLARRGYLFFFCTINVCDSINGFKEIEKNCYVTDQYYLILRELKGFIFEFYSTSPHPDIETVKTLQKDNIVVYEYIDHIHEAITGDNANFQLMRHKAIDPDVIFASAGDLYEEMLAKNGGEKVFYLPNAVDYDHFQIHKDEGDIPPDMRDIIRKGKVIVGYYGALASWIDYELINGLARRRPDLEIVLIGWDYDGSMQRIEKLDNIHYLGTKPYGDLPKYGSRFDVAIIPFVKGDIADSTSPLKLFEYMALGKPIVITDMKECKRYGSVLSARDDAEFFDMIDKALRLRNDVGYLALLDREARANTWQKRAEEFDVRVQAAMRKRRPSPSCDIDGHSDVHPLKGTFFYSMLMNAYSVRDFHEVTDPTKKMWLDFALSTVTRGEAACNLISRHTEVKGKRYLDIGCGYGGFVVAFAKAGASGVVGIDINPTCLEYGRALLGDYGLTFPIYQRNILSSDDITDLGAFDIITCNDVIEHVECPDTAIKRMASLLREKGMLFMEIPNKFSAAFIRADGHFKLFGITILPKWLADRYFAGFFPSIEHDVRYRSLPYYLNTLRSSGFETCVVSVPNLDSDIKLKEIRGTMEECRKSAERFSGTVPAELRDNIVKRVLRITGLFERMYDRYLLLRESDGEMAKTLAERLIMTFGEDFWTVIAKKV